MFREGNKVHPLPEENIPWRAYVGYRNLRKPVAAKVTTKDKKAIAVVLITIAFLIITWVMWSLSTFDFPDSQEWNLTALIACMICIVGSLVLYGISFIGLFVSWELSFVLLVFTVLISSIVHSLDLGVRRRDKGWW